MHGALFFACSNMSRTRAAPTPTNISTKSEPEIEKNGTLASPAIALASSVLPVPGEPTISTPRGMRPPSFWNLDGSRRNSTSSLTSSFASSQPATSANVIAVVRLVEHLGLALAEAERAAAPAALHLAHEEDPDADQQQHREPRDEHLREERLLLVGLGLDLDAVLDEVADHPDVAGAVGDEALLVARHPLDRAAFDRRRLDAALPWPGP